MTHAAATTVAIHLAERRDSPRGYLSRGFMSSSAQPEVLARWARWDAIERGDEPWPEDGRPRR